MRRRGVARVFLVLGMPAAVAGIAAQPRAAAAPVLRVCADPNNLPFSNRAEQGLENKVAGLIARDLGAELRYIWWAQRRGFVRHTLNAGRCDLIPGIPAGVEAVRTTAPYYRSAYVFVTRRTTARPIVSFDDPRLRSLRIGVHLVGEDYRNTPPVDALARRGIVRNVVGYSIYGDYREPNPPARLVEAVAAGSIDVAIVWGPLGGYFATRAPGLRVTPVGPVSDGGTPLAFSIAMGVRPADTALARRVDAALSRRREEIARLLRQYAVPRVPTDAREAR